MHDTIFDFSTRQQVDSWQVVADQTSTDMWQWKSTETAHFAGKVSQKNKYGLVSIRCLVPGLKADNGVAIKVRGAQQYDFKVRTDPFADGITYIHPFRPSPERWKEIKLPFKAFQPSFRGLNLPDATPLDPAKIQQIGIIISSNHFGPFSLEIDWIKVF